MDGARYNVKSMLERLFAELFGLQFMQMISNSIYFMSRLMFA